MLSINHRDPRPIYEQVRDSLRTLILSGAYAADDKLPSVRELASQLAINPNTIQRAYRELESEGYIVSIPGKGSFVASGDSALDARKAELKEKFLTAAAELRAIGVDDAELIAMLKEGEV